MRDPEEILKDLDYATLNPQSEDELQSTVNKLLEHKSRYEKVGDQLSIPYWVIGAIHYRESSFDFTTWLANGDPLIRHGRPAVTIHVPKGLGPCQSWEDAALLSLKTQKWHSGLVWDLVSSLQRLEAYNGMGYLNRGLRSPYIWSGTNLYHTGKYGKDGRFDPYLRDKQLGCAAIAKALNIELPEPQVVLS